jgi:D-sedoheptulose 7-phosphate isomerase
LSDIIASLPAEQIDEIVRMLKEAHEQGKHVLLCGNGGSGALASHLACDLQKGIGCLTDRKFRALAITDAMPLVTAWANDTEYSNIFAEQVATWARPGDMLIAISGSGNSPNVLRAVEMANEIGVTTVALTGMGGGKLAPMSTKAIVVPSDNMQQIEDIHVILGHLIYTCLYKEISECG